jgi:hypothetical protein
VNNPFQPPRARLEPTQHEPRPIWQAVLLGGVVDYGGTQVVTFVLFSLYGLMLAGQGQTAEQVRQTFTHLTADATVVRVAMALGLIMSGVGGYVCAYFANRRTYTAVGILSALMVALGAASQPADANGQTQLLLTVIQVAVTFLAAWLHIRRLSAPSAGQ